MSDERPFSIHYSDLVVHGRTRSEWDAAPNQGVQVVVEWRTPSQEQGEWTWTGVKDRFLWTGQDEYNPFGWEVKYGSLIGSEEYLAIWESAAYGN